MLCCAVIAGARETSERPSESVHAMEDDQDFAAQQAVQTTHAVHHADWDHPGGPAGSDDSVLATEARLWNQGSGAQAIEMSSSVTYCPRSFCLVAS